MQFTPAVGSQPKRGTTMALTIWVSGPQELYGSSKRGHTWCVGIHRFTALGWDLRPGFWSMGVIRVFITRSGLLQKRNCQLDLALSSQAFQGSICCSGEYGACVWKSCLSTNGMYKVGSQSYPPSHSNGEATFKNTQ